MQAGTKELQIGGSVMGTIDGKFDNGYLVTVRLGSDQFKGVLYHIPKCFNCLRVQILQMYLLAAKGRDPV